MTRDKALQELYKSRRDVVKNLKDSNVEYKSFDKRKELLEEQVERIDDRIDKHLEMVYGKQKEGE